MAKDLKKMENVQSGEVEKQTVELCTQLRQLHYSNNLSKKKREREGETTKLQQRAGGRGGMVCRIRGKGTML